MNTARKIPAMISTKTTTGGVYKTECDLFYWGNYILFLLILNFSLYLCGVRLELSIICTY